MDQGPASRGLKPLAFGRPRPGESAEAFADRMYDAIEASMNGVPPTAMLDPFVGEDTPFCSDDDYRWEGELVHALNLGDRDAVQKLVAEAPDSDYARLILELFADELRDVEPQG